jgi:lipoprotein-anchoring transpeptidase ErfK/SrfK
MARYPSSSYGRRKNRIRKWIYIISAMVIILVIAFIGGYYPFSKDKSEPEGVLSEMGRAVEAPPPELGPEAEPNLQESAPEPTTEASPEVSELIVEAMADINSKPTKIIEARDKLNEALPMAMSSQQRAFIKEQLTQLANEWLFSPKIFPQDRLCSSYLVKHGELLSTISKQHKVPYEILQEINKIYRPEGLRAGEKIKVINGPFHARIYRSSFTMDLFLQNTYVRSFKVGLGKPGRETPTGLWRVKPDGKLKTPTWTDPDTGKTYKAEDPDYPLGSRWIGLEGIKGDAVGRTGIAFHGTKDPHLIGTADSRGCIRLDNGDVILVYNLLVPIYSQVEIVE